MIRSTIILLFTILTAIPSGLYAKELKVLTIGNSFSISLIRNLPQIVKYEKKHRLILTSAYIGGCSLARHIRHLREVEADPAKKPYSVSVWDSEKVGNRYNPKPVAGSVNALLKNNQYDVITIQQASAFSWKPESYEPYAGELIQYIRKYQKNAEIVIQQTWSYRCDEKRLTAWKIDQKTMHEKLQQAYKKLSANYHLRVIPTGDAVMLYRSRTPQKFVPSAPGKVYKEPELPNNAGDAVGKPYWRTHPKTKKRYLLDDRIHLNNRGEFMQGALWYAFLFNEDARQIKYVQRNMAADEAKLLKECAQQALENYQQIK